MTPTPSIAAVFENGVFRPLGPVDLPEHAQVRVLPVAKSVSEKPVTGLAKTAGALAHCWTEEDDRILAEIAAERHAMPLREPGV